MAGTRDYNRQPNGHFGIGNDGSPGRKPRKVEQEYLNIAIGAVSQEDWAAIIKMVKALAAAGDMTAVKWLGDYLLGKPTTRVDLTTNEAPQKGYIGISPDDWDSDGADGSEDHVE